MTDTDDTEIMIGLDGATALVLFEFLSRFDESDRLTIADDAERAALWRLLGDLEKRLVAPFAPDYAERLAAARAALRRRAGPESG